MCRLQRGAQQQRKRLPQRLLPDVSLTEIPQSAVLSTAEGLWEALQQRVTRRRPLAGLMQHGRPLTLMSIGSSLALHSNRKFSFEDLLEQPNKVLIANAVQELLGRALTIDLKLVRCWSSRNPDVPGTESSPPSKRWVLWMKYSARRTN